MERSRSQHFAVLIRDAGRAYVAAETTPARSAAFDQLRCAVELAKAETPTALQIKRQRRRQQESDLVSPIEIALLVAIVELVEFADRTTAKASLDDGLALTVDGIATTCDQWTMLAQVRVRGYQTDFMAIKGRLVFAIECDGHEFHERTADQALHDRARDRSLLLIGIPTLRFTGREILRNADRCAAQILAFARQLDERTR